MNLYPVRRAFWRWWGSFHLSDSLSTLTDPVWRCTPTPVGIAILSENGVERPLAIARCGPKGVIIIGDLVPETERVFSKGIQIGVCIGTKTDLRASSN